MPAVQQAAGPCGFYDIEDVGQQRLAPVLSVELSATEPPALPGRQYQGVNPQSSLRPGEVLRVYPTRSSAVARARRIITPAR